MIDLLLRSQFGGGSTESAEIAVIKETGHLTIAFQTDAGAVVTDLSMLTPEMSLDAYKANDDLHPQDGSVVIFIDNTTTPGSPVLYMGKSDGNADILSNGVTGATTVSTLHATGAVTLDTTLELKGDGDFDGDVDISGTLTGVAGTFSGLVTGSGFKVGATAGIDGTIDTSDAVTITVVKGIITAIV